MFYHSKGLVYSEINNFEQAIKMFKKSLEIKKDHMPSLFHLGLMQHKNCNYKEALASFTQVLDT